MSELGGTVVASFGHVHAVHGGAAHAAAQGEIDHGLSGTGKPAFCQSGGIGVVEQKERVGKVPANPFIDPVGHPDDRCVGYGFLVCVDDDGHGNAGSQQFVAGNLVRIQKLFDLGAHEPIIIVIVAERTADPCSGDDIDVQIDHNDGQMIPCNVDPQRIAGMGNAPEQMGFSAAGRIKRTGIVDESVCLELIQIVSDGWKAQSQLFGNDLSGALPAVIDQAVNIACIF